MRRSAGSLLAALSLFALGSVMAPRVAEARRLGLSELELAHEPQVHSTNIPKVRRVTRVRKQAAVGVRFSFTSWARPLVSELLPPTAAACVEPAALADAAGSAIDDLEIEAIIPDVAVSAQDRRPTLPEARAICLRAPPERDSHETALTPILHPELASMLAWRVRTLAKLPDSDDPAAS